MTIKSFAAVAAIALSAFTAQAQAVETWTVTATGHITSGVDTSGVFGAAGQDLSGLLYSMSITASIDPALWTAGYELYFAQVVNGTGPGFASTVTLNGQSISTTALSTVSGGQQVINGKYQGRPGAVDAVVSVQEGYTSNGEYLKSWIQVITGNSAFVSSPLLNQSLSQATDSTYSTQTDFWLSGPDRSVKFQGKIDNLTVAAVPEPESYAMLLAGLGLVGAIARRRKTKA